ncbi:hypothetical protein [Caulobacter sp. BE254]|uniref:hypothetical protein n=1 Tax=Caulobacter sp. BE254 TaxID=2817720 RepID=UPI0028554A92|nr:hypothetical protein [Caulobacter sp. BE254]MDR7118149.1 hypothetical protein [Caulobacter sp. BE254]
MITRRNFSLLLSGGLAAPAPAALAAAPVPALRRAEARRLQKYAETTHPRGWEAAADPAWRSGWDRLAAEADGLTTEAWVMGLVARLAWFRDGHTTIYTHMIKLPGFDLDLPITASPFFDGLYVTAAKAEGAALLGGRIVRVDGVAVEQVLRAFAAVWPANNAAGAYHHAGLALKPAVLRGARLAGPAAVSAPVTLEAEVEGSVVKVALTPRPDGGDALVALSRKLWPVEAWRPGAQANFVHADGKVLVIAFDRLSDKRDSILAFVRDAFAAMETPEIERVVLDLRRNDGGNNFMGEGLRRRLERSRFNRPGGLYVLTSGKTFSAAQNLTSRIERETWAVFVGEPSGGAPNHYGDAMPFQADGFPAYVSTLPWFDSDPLDKRIWTMPDVLVPLRFADWTAGRDAAMEAACAHVDNRTLDDLSEARTLYSDRPSQKAEWKPFWI